MDRNGIRHDPRHLGVPLGASKIVFEPMVHSAQTVHLSCVTISTISEQTKMSFHLNLVTKEYHQVCPKWFLSLWYVWCKPCTYLAPTQTLSPNGPKRDLTWPTWPRSCIGCVQNGFQADGTFVQTLHLSCTNINTISKWTETRFHMTHHGVPSGVSKMISVPMVHSAQTMRLSYTNTNIVSKWTKTRFDMTHVT
jgi:hypothetical protein